MSYKSLAEIADNNNVGGRRAETWQITINIRNQNGSPIMAFGLSRNLMAASGLKPGERVDVLYNPEAQSMIIKRVLKGGRKISKGSGDRGVFQVRYYPELGMPKIKKLVRIKEAQLGNDQITFSL